MYIKRLMDLKFEAKIFERKMYVRFILKNLISKRRFMDIRRTSGSLGSISNLKWISDEMFDINVLKLECSYIYIMFLAQIMFCVH